MRRTALVAACVDVWYFILFQYLGVPQLAWPNISSVVLYLTAYALLRLRINTAAVVLIWIEVTLHSMAGTLLIGWESGFHYHLLLFIPAIVANCGATGTRLLLALLFLCYAGLDVSAYLFGIAAPIPQSELILVRWTNMGIVFAMLTYCALCYRIRLRQAEERVRISATHDLQTGLLNRHHFMAMTELVLALQRRGERPISLALIEIDQLRAAGPARHGDTADHILTEVCHVLRQGCRQEDLMARGVGDEIVALLPDTNLAGALVVAERMRAAVADHDASEGTTPLRCTVSIGVAELQAPERFHDALSRAERALERSRACGGNSGLAEPSPPVHACGALVDRQAAIAGGGA
jgi:diguanylate cyclase (GGDEF)-like protein